MFISDVILSMTKKTIKLFCVKDYRHFFMTMSYISAC